MSTSQLLWVASSAPAPLASSDFSVYDGSSSVRSASAPVNGALSGSSDRAYQDALTSFFELNWTPLTASSNPSFPEPTPLYEYSLGSTAQGQQWATWTVIPQPWSINERGDYFVRLPLPRVFNSSSLSSSRLQFSSVRATVCSGASVIVNSAGLLLTDLAPQCVLSIDAYDTVEKVVRLGPQNTQPFTLRAQITDLQAPISNVSWSDV
jgi:hypothetical protein